MTQEQEKVMLGKDFEKYKRPLKFWPETLCCVALRLPRTMTVSLPCACALALGCLAALLVPPDGALGKEVQLQQFPEPRVARWFTNINKYMEKLFNNRSKKPPKHKKPSNSTNSTPSSVTVHPHLNITNSTTVKHQPTPSTGRTTGAPALSLLP